MTVDRRVDLAIAGVTIALGALILVLTRRIGTTLIIDPIGPRGFGYLISGALMLGGLAAVISRLRRWDENEGNNNVPSDGAADEDDVPVSANRPILVVLAAAAYIALLQPLGFLIVTPLFLGALLYMMRTRNVRGRIVIPIVFTIVVFVVFSQGLNVNLPVGPFRPLFIRYGLLTY
jgi:hypothetical protein